MSGLTTWRELLVEELKIQNDGPCIRTTLTDAEMDIEFDAGYGVEEGLPFLAWTEKRVYFSCCYDGREFVASVPRNPCDEKPEHLGS